jgi:hypothetical protein
VLRGKEGALKIAAAANPPVRDPLPTLQRFVYAGCHPAGRRFLPGEFFAEPMSRCDAQSTEFCPERLAWRLRRRP